MSASGQAGPPGPPPPRASRPIDPAAAMRRARDAAIQQRNAPAQPGVFALAHIELLLNLDVDSLTYNPQAVTDDRRREMEFSKQGWFRYFWKEARGQDAKVRANAGPILALFNAMYVLPPGWDQTQALDPNLEIREGVLKYRGGTPPAQEIRSLTPRTADPWAAVPDATLRAALEAMLYMGFERIDVVPHDPNEVGLPEVKFARHKLVYQEAGIDHAFRLGWRGDGRALQDIRKDGGMRSKSESTIQGFADRLNMRQAWHPFQDVNIRRHYWFRRTQEDNCLHTVVSVSTDFSTAASFPLLEETLSGKLRKLPQLASEIPADMQKKFSKLTVMTASGQRKEIFRYVDKQQIYMVLLHGGFFDTKKKQAKKFPEVAVKHIPMEHILGYVEFFRVFHGLTDNDGLTIYVNKNAGQRLRPTVENCVAATGSDSVGRRLFTDALAFYVESTGGGNPLSTRWTGTGSKKERAPFNNSGYPLMAGSEKVTRIEAITDISGRRVIYRPSF